MFDREKVRKIVDPDFFTRLLGVRTIIVHPGTAHMDDFLTVALVRGILSDITILRREPTPEDLEDPHILVADVGGVHDPLNMCFDHHQDRELPASFVLVLQAAGVWDLFKDCFPWATFTSDMDTRGPTEVCRSRGIPEGVGREFINPIASFALASFELYTQYSFDQMPLITEIGKHLWDELTEWQDAKDEVDRSTTLVETGEDGVCRPFLLYEGRISPLIDRALVHSGIAHGYVGTITKSGRNHGWRLYRINDNPHVDFTRIAYDRRVRFAHANGFMAETFDVIPITELHELVGKALI